MKKLIQSLFILVLFAYSVMAQERTITGTVTSGDDKQAIPGVSVKTIGAPGGIFTDAEGKFSIKASSAATALEFSYIGYAKQTKTITANTVNVVLTPDAIALYEVVVAALGQVRKIIHYNRPLIAGQR
ncbi:carboxypeptidase-like regulatory domain-containing protein [Pedobacter miscanthi]|uniref:carboxypeptidase-like regulatory domain-containing protein n=1 Tax=Pedobacter miscanthi TaxID=2259170 RepID=UPI00292E350A|nr:carboxypeptidase-like regulatory domain-containing protein [Pedobacter miscanthi]